MRSRRRFHGYFDMGRIRIPPAPPMLILTDRVTGCEYAVVFSTDVPTVDDLGHIGLDPDISTCRRRACTIYKAGEEPYIGTNPYRRLIVTEGRLALEIVDLPPEVQDMDNAPLSAVKGWDRNPRLIVDYSGILNDRLAWTPWSDVD